MGNCVWTTEELVLLIHLLNKRAATQSIEDRMHQDLHDAATCRDMLTAKLAELMGDDQVIHQLFLDAEAQLKAKIEESGATGVFHDAVVMAVSRLSEAALDHSWHNLESCRAHLVAAVARIMEAEKRLQQEIVCAEDDADDR